MCKVCRWDPIIFRRYITCQFSLPEVIKLSGETLTVFYFPVNNWEVSGPLFMFGVFRAVVVTGPSGFTRMCTFPIVNTIYIYYMYPVYRPLYNYIQHHYMVKPRILLHVFKSLVKWNCTQNGRDSKITNFFVFALTNNQSLTGTCLWFNKSGQTAQHYRLWNKNKNWLDYSYKMYNNMSEWRDRCTCRLSFQLSL